ncbi:MAG: AzlD domain-containing protein [Burkholderiaceae bacterium]
MNELIVVLAAALGTYGWRFLGLVLSGRIRTDSEFFQWISCVTYAMVAGLVFRIVVLPVGLLAQIPLGTRLICIGAALIVMVWPYRPFRGLVPAILVGTALMVGAGLHFLAPATTP